ncbi:hypothetical protein HZ994_01120 [Akkermansiaceae bacterium]|nr:hypothetical protein HZ994_01120 [Akkermansiaceae bacterium]
MKTILTIAKPVSWVSLLLIVAPPLLHFSGTIKADLMTQLLLAGTFIWFVSASLWMKSE